jgi:heme-degrading monooxygenase HmoA
MMCGFKYIKHNKARFKPDKREEGIKILANFFKEYENQIKGFKGFIIMNNANDLQETIALTFWETKKIWIHIISLIINGLI